MIIENTDFVTIYFEGLMICCFNEKEQRFETAIVRRDNHNFSVRVVKYSGTEKIDDNEYKGIPSQNVSFNFEGKGIVEVEGFSKYQSGSFNRQDEQANDPHDIRWIVDLESEEFYNSSVEPTKESSSVHNMPLLPVYVKNAKFSVDGLTTYNTDKIEEDENGNEINREFFGKYGYVLSAVINADNVSLNFQGTQIPEMNLDRNEGFNYKVFITNTREGGDEQHELPVYYRVVKHASGRRFNIEQNFENEVELYNRHNNCGKIMLGKTETIENFE